MNTIYEVRKYEVHECTNAGAKVLCLIVSEDLRGFRLVLPLLTVPNINTMEEAQKLSSVVFEKGCIVVPVEIDGYKFADITQIRLVCADKLVAYRATITNSDTINALDEAIDKALGRNIRTVYTGCTEGCTKLVNKYDVWNTTNNTPYTKVMVLHEAVNNYIVCPIHNETAQTIVDVDQFVVDKWKIGHVCVPFYNNNELRFVYISKMFSIGKDNLVSRSYNVNDNEVRKNIDIGILKEFNIHDCFTLESDETHDSEEDTNVVCLHKDSVLTSDSFTEETQEVVESDTDTTEISEVKDAVEETVEDSESTEEESEQVIDFSNIGSDVDHDSDVVSYEEDLVPEKPVKRYSTHSRKKIPMPENFGFYYDNIEKGIIKKSELVKIYHVSPPVIIRWIKEYEEYRASTAINVQNVSE